MGEGHCAISRTANGMGTIPPSGRNFGGELRTPATKAILADLVRRAKRGRARLVYASKAADISDVMVPAQSQACARSPRGTRHEIARPSSNVVGRLYDQQASHRPRSPSARLRDGTPLGLERRPARPKVQRRSAGARKNNARPSSPPRPRSCRRAPLSRCSLRVRHRLRWFAAVQGHVHLQIDPDGWSLSDRGYLIQQSHTRLRLPYRPWASVWSPTFAPASLPLSRRRSPFPPF